MPTTKVTTISVSWRQAVALALVILLALPAGVRAQNRVQELPGLVSGKKIAVLAVIAAGVAVTLIWLKKRSQKSPKSPSITHERLEFGAVRLGAAAEGAVTLANRTNEPMTIRRVVVAGRSFSVVSALVLPMVLAPHSQTTLQLKFDPFESRAFTGRLDIQTAVGDSDVRTSRVSLSGKGA